MEQHSKTQSFIAACLGMMFFGISFVVMGSVLPAMAEKYLLTEAESSLLVTFLPIGILIGSLLFGPIIDRYGYKWLLVLSSAMIAGGLIGLSLLNNLNQFRICIFFIGVGGGILNGATNSLVAEIYEGKQGASRLSLLGMFYGLGALGIPLLLSIFSKTYSYEVILQWTSFVILLSIIYFLTVKLPQPKFKQGFPITDALKLAKEPALLLLSFVLFFQSGLEGLLNNWSTSYLVLWLSEENALLALTALILGITLARLALGYFMTKLKAKNILTFGILILTLGVIGLNFSRSFGIGVASLLTIGVGLAGVFPLIIGKIGSRYKAMTGTAISIALVIALSGNSLLNYLMGSLSKWFSISAFPKFLLCCIALQVVILFVGRKYLAED